MTIVFGLIVLVLLGGRVFGYGRALQIALIGIILAAVLAIQLTLPQGHGLREATGGSVAVWVIVLAIAAIVGLYVLGLNRLRKAAARRADTANPPQPDTMSPQELERYARHIVLREIGGPGQMKLRNARVLLVGAGGLGSPALLYLAAAGVGTIGVVDDDTVSLSNLQRQVLHSDADIGKPKVFSAQHALRALNPNVKILPYNRRLDADTASDLIGDFDLVLDGSDNFATRYLVNATCVALGVPLVSAAISQWEGQISLYHPTTGGPCYACVFPEIPAEGLAPSCAEAGVMGALPGVLGSMMAVEAIKWLSGAGQPLQGQMLIFDALFSENRKVTLARSETCAVCGVKHQAE